MLLLLPPLQVLALNNPRSVSLQLLTAATLALLRAHRSAAGRLLLLP
jgi:hypothetical protein